MISYYETYKVRFGLARMVFAAAILFTAPAGAQSQLTDAQAMALIQALGAQAQNPAANAMTQAQFQQLLQYVARQSQAAGSSAAANTAQAQMMQALAAQSALAAPNTAVNAAQAQMLMQTLTAQNQSFLKSAPVEQQLAPTTPMPTVANQPAAIAAKKPGAIRIGVAQPRAQMGQGNSGANVSEPIRGMIMNYLSGPMLDVIPLTSLLQAQLDAEAKQKDCDYVLYSGLTMTLNSGGMGLLKKAMPLASMIPMVGIAGGMAGAATAAAAGTALSGAAGVAGTVKAKSEVKFEYQLIAQGNPTPLVANTSTARAKTDGEDVITPLIAKADETIFAALTKK